MTALVGASRPRIRFLRDGSVVDQSVRTPRHYRLQREPAPIGILCAESAERQGVVLSRNVRGTRRCALKAAVVGRLGDFGDIGSDCSRRRWPFDKEIFVLPLLDLFRSAWGHRGNSRSAALRRDLRPRAFTLIDRWA